MSCDLEMRLVITRHVSWPRDMSWVHNEFNWIDTASKVYSPMENAWVETGQIQIDRVLLLLLHWAFLKMCFTSSGETNGSVLFSGVSFFWLWLPFSTSNARRLAQVSGSNLCLVFCWRWERSTRDRAERDQGTTFSRGWWVGQTPAEDKAKVETR